MEQQMCSYVPGGDEMAGDSDSPDRMDALVWAITDLVITPQEERGKVVINPVGSYQISAI